MHLERIHILSPFTTSLPTAPTHTLAINVERSLLAWLIHCWLIQLVEPASYVVAASIEERLARSYGMYFVQCSLGLNAQYYSHIQSFKFHGHIPVNISSFGDGMNSLVTNSSCCCCFLISPWPRVACGRLFLYAASLRHSGMHKILRIRRHHFGHIPPLPCYVE